MQGGVRGIASSCALAMMAGGHAGAILPHARGFNLVRATAHGCGRHRAQRPARSCRCGRSAPAPPRRGTLGNAGRGILIGPSLRSFDLSLAKNTPVRKLGESGNLQFRAEAFNLLNHANFGIPNLIVYAGGSATEAPIGTFGRIQNTITSARQIQLALRLSF